jgi:hypothetical protein
MAACKRQKKMAQRQQQPIISSLLILGVATLIVVVNLASNLNSPTLFLLKAVSQLVNSLSRLHCLRQNETGRTNGGASRAD